MPVDDVPGSAARMCDLGRARPTYPDWHPSGAACPNARKALNAVIRLAMAAADHDYPMVEKLAIQLCHQPLYGPCMTCLNGQVRDRRSAQLANSSPNATLLASQLPGITRTNWRERYSADHSTHCGQKLHPCAQDYQPAAHRKYSVYSLALPVSSAPIRPETIPTVLMKAAHGAENTSANAWPLPTRTSALPRPGISASNPPTIDNPSRRRQHHGYRE